MRLPFGLQLRVDVGDVHAIGALLSGAFVALSALSCLVAEWRDEKLYFVVAAALVGCTWSGLFALVLRGTLFTRLVAALGIGLAIFSLVIGTCAVSVHGSF